MTKPSKEIDGQGHEVCPRCSHFKTCRTPCFPVAEYLRRDNLTVFEKSHTDPATGQTTTILFSRSREMVESDMLLDDGHPAAMAQRVFSTDSESPFAGFTPDLKQTGIFFDRFFGKLSYADLAEKYEMSEHVAIGTFHNAVKRVLEILKAMDSAKMINMTHRKKVMEERSGKMSKGQKWFLLNKLFGVMPHEIAEMEGMRESSSVRQLIIRTSDQYRAGEIRLIDTTPAESEAAKLRLDANREKRRERRERSKVD